jgi:hypothetical protein
MKSTKIRKGRRHERDEGTKGTKGTKARRDERHEGTKGTKRAKGRGNKEKIMKIFVLFETLWNSSLSSFCDFIVHCPLKKGLPFYRAAHN